MLPIVDIHCHYVSSDPAAQDNFRRLVDSPDLFRVVVCALDLKLEYSDAFPFMSTWATTNEELLNLVRALDSEKIVPFCHIDPRESDAAKQAEYWIKEQGMRGIKMYPPSGWYPDEPRVLPTFQMAEQFDVPVLLHMGRVAPHPQLRSKYARPICLEDVGLACPKLKLIIGHSGCPWQWEAARVADGFPNFFLDLTTSGSLDLALLKDVAEYEFLGIRRIVLGTDGDGSNNLQRAAATLERLRSAGFTEEQLEMIAHHNGLTVLGKSA